MRADAKKNYAHLLATAGEVIKEHGVEASLRDIARKADVGLATLYRHFPTREALLEALLRKTLDELTREAAKLEQTEPPQQALLLWINDAVRFVRSYNGAVAVMSAALDDVNSALHASCSNLRSAGARLLENAQTAGVARPDISGLDLFAIIGALGWIGDQPSFGSRAEHLFGIIAGSLLTVGSDDSIKLQPRRPNAPQNSN
ncbi:TetR/AcrR family transcriptional regulator [Azospirillum picis]|uniref:AcrR family transcriptional regulator n=1 Tax=Azospirillum picis TaxID=488438 RepID=A0ABU0MQD7_9PROT|nr:TetR/AcrR family transcriptional regulator [Azospirillum picis]MBP2302019.1 AcrR family transcriptional regulator [Azospirillum picis]MDQ0535690.1 AcrR family transcriptional regulator [Azospirillum picis]